VTTPGDAAAVDALVTAQANAQATLTARTIALLAALWQRLTDPTDQAQLATFTSRAATVIRSAEVATGRVTEAYLRQVLRRIGMPALPAETLVSLPDSVRQGAPNIDVVARAPATVRYLRSVGTPDVNAYAAGLDRLETAARTNIELALRLATPDVLKHAPGIRGYRRILRPYLSAGGSCGLCIAASDRIYKVDELLPIHAKCKCGVLPVTRRMDPGLKLNSADLDRIYAAAGGTGAAKLKRVRYRLEQHGELGPVLVPQGQQFRSADEAAGAVLGGRRKLRQAPRDFADTYQAQLSALEDSLPALEARAAAGEDVEAAITWQRARIAELRRQLAA
jgi:hypothetical protein